MGLDNVPRCRHVKVNGIQCGSPALRRRRYCFFHDRMLDGKRRFAADSQSTPRPLFSMVLLEDANSVQVALMQVLSLLGSGQMDHKTAGLMLYGLQTASSNLKHTKFEAEKPTDVVIDRDDVDRTCIHGPQWFAREFPDEVEEKRVEEAAAQGAIDNDNNDKKETTASGKAAAQCRTGSPSKLRKRPEPATTQEQPPPEWVHGIMRGLGIPTGTETSVASG